MICDNNFLAVKRFLVVLLLTVASAASQAAAPGRSPAWQPWSDGVFEQAAREDRYVILYLEAVWCHWCHVMDQETYTNPDVIKLIGSRYLPVKVDQDASPDLSRHYENYGWPATVVFNAKGEEIVKLRGYKPPEVMLRVLQAIVDDPSPVNSRDSAQVTSFSPDASLKPALRSELQRRFRVTHDSKLGGMDQSQKFIDRDTIEYGLLRTGQGDTVAAMLVKQTLDGALKLIDPVWGGMYQYSTDGDWEHPHFEKIMQIQADAMRLYAMAFAQFHEPRYRKAAEDIHRYLKMFLQSPEGAFYVSQDADVIKGEHSGEYFALPDEARRKRGIPQVDKHLYARENGWVIQSLTALFDATGERKYLDDAERAAAWVLNNRALPNGGFRHDQMDRGGPYLEDTLTMGRAFAALYTSTGKREWLAHAEHAAGFIVDRFSNDPRPGYLSAPQTRHAVLKLSPLVDENIAFARFANLLARYTGNSKYGQSAERAMRYLATSEVALFRRTEAGVLLADSELAEEPTHITVVGGKDDPNAALLHQAALAYPGVYRRIEWWDTREGAMPNPDVQYPQLQRAAAFVCSNKTCSRPIFKVEDIGKTATRRAEQPG